jgi:hypothetical protein
MYKHDKANIVIFILKIFAPNSLESFHVPQLLATIAHTQIEASTSMRIAMVCLHEKLKLQKRKPKKTDLII